MSTLPENPPDKLWQVLEQAVGAQHTVLLHPGIVSLHFFGELCDSIERRASAISETEKLTAR